MAIPRGSSGNDILCVILHFGDSADTWECLDSIKDEPGIDVVIVDNDPGQCFELPRPWASVASVVRSGGEMGFAQANNLGAKKARRDHHFFLLLLNNDTVVSKGTISSLRDTLKDPNIGMVGPVMPYWNSPQELWAAGGTISPFLVTIDGRRDWPKSAITDVDYLPGAAFLTRSELWEEIGGLSERYFLAFEEAQFAGEVKKRGYRVVVNRNATVAHKVGMSSDRQPMYYYNTVRNRMRFGQYLFGTRLGLFWGALSGFFRSYSPIRLRLWAIAVYHELSGSALSRNELLAVKKQFTKKSPK